MATWNRETLEPIRAQFRTFIRDFGNRLVGLGTPLISAAFWNWYNTGSFVPPIPTTNNAARMALQRYVPPHVLRYVEDMVPDVF